MIKIIGILNLTPDSFYAPSRTVASEVIPAARKMLEEGAWGIDLGAVSTRPGSTPVPEDEEWARLSPALELIRKELPDVRFSVDTYRSSIVRKVYDMMGPFIVNDVSAGAMDPEMLTTVGELGLPYIAMHLHGAPSSPVLSPDPIVEDVLCYFNEFAAKAADAGIQNWILDPGFGFSKTIEQNWELLYGMGALKVFCRPILAGVSRKSMIWKRFGLTPEEALPSTQAAHLIALQQGAAYLRVHDVAEAVQTVAIFEDTAPGGVL